MERSARSTCPWAVIIERATVQSQNTPIDFAAAPGAASAIPTAVVIIATLPRMAAAFAMRKATPRAASGRSWREERVEPERGQRLSRDDPDFEHKRQVRERGVCLERDELRVGVARNVQLRPHEEEARHAGGGRCGVRRARPANGASGSVRGMILLL